MPRELTGQAFERLLDQLDADRTRAGEQYEDLRRTLVRFFEWRGAPFPEDHADEALDRVARRLSEGVAIANIGGYCYSVARLVMLEALKGPDSRRVAIDPMDLRPAADLNEESAEHEQRLACLHDCLRALPTEGRQLIVDYYRDEKRARIERRRTLAARLGLKPEALANRAQRLRDKLEGCVSHCVRGRSAT